MPSCGIEALMTVQISTYSGSVTSLSSDNSWIMALSPRSDNDISILWLAIVFDF